MLNDLKNFCNVITLVPVLANEHGIHYDGTLDNVKFCIVRKDSEITFSMYDDTLFTAFVTILQAKYKTLLTQKRNVVLMGKKKEFNMVRFNCKKITKIKTILSHVEKLYFELRNEKLEEKVGL